MLNQKSRKSFYFFSIHSHINYGNIAWGSTYKTKLKRIIFYQKKADRVIFFPDCMAHSKSLILTSMHSKTPNKYISKLDSAPATSFNKFSKINHNYLTSSKNSSNYTIFKVTIKLTNFAISRRGSILWNTVLDATLKEIFTILT